MPVCIEQRVLDGKLHFNLLATEENSQAVAVSIPQGDEREE